MNRSVEDIKDWLNKCSANTYVNISKISLNSCSPWYYDLESGQLRNPSNSFFRISGIKCSEYNDYEQPIIIQDEIGYLGIICRRINGEMYYLMQAKIEPGNINKVQISPTIQATKSNFLQRHGGSKPAYLDYFINSFKYRIIADQIQSEQASRFLGKRNRNIIIEVNEDIEIMPNYLWMTLSEIKELMREDNIVNMDTRTVLACLPAEKYIDEIKDTFFLRSVLGGQNYLSGILRYLNDYKMFRNTRRELIPLLALSNWEMRGSEFVCRQPYNFKLIFCDIDISGREVRHWCQPMFEATGIATFALMTRVHNSVREFLIKATPEIGCFDEIELGPTIQRESVHKCESTDVDMLFDNKIKNMDGIVFDTLLSEEGGRFYHEQNRNVIMEISDDEIDELPPGYFWSDYKTLNMLVQVNNCLNIQLRNLLSVLEW